MNLNEANTRKQLIDRALESRGWKDAYLNCEYTFTDGKKTPGGGKGQQCSVDYLLQYNNTNVGLIEAKREGLPITEGLQQAQDYGDKLGVRFVYSTNGHGIYEYDMESDVGVEIDTYPTPEELYQRVQGDNPLKIKMLSESLIQEGSMIPRYYQKLAVQRAIGAIADGSKRVLLTLATGTGKTFIAYQIVRKLLNLKWRVDGKEQQPKVLFLADRNILVDQAINTFNNIERQIVKVDGDEIRKRNGIVPSSANVYFAIYQAITGGANDEEILEYYKQYPKDFFDIIIIDECHRGSANDEGSWRRVLDHFQEAVHLGLTATPKRDENVDTYNYFGKPVYEYSLKEGINDGFLTPYKVKRVRTNLDEYVFKSGDRVKSGELGKQQYDQSEFNRTIIIPERIDKIAQSILDLIRPMDKTIVFCVDQEHALRLRDAINKHKTVRDKDYCVRVTAAEGQRGKEKLEQFQDNDKDIPVILTSSQMLTTGVDARNVRNIVLARNINSMVEFKQIVGRGTRIFEGKDYFTIVDYTGATNNFYDEEWDGDAEEREQITSSTKSKTVSTIKVSEPNPDYKKKQKVIVKLAQGRTVDIIDIDTRYVGSDGTPLDAEKFLKQLVGSLPSLYKDVEQLRTIWKDPSERAILFTELENAGFGYNNLKDLKSMMNAEDSDIFDVLAYLSFNTPMKTRKERVLRVNDNEQVFAVYSNFKAIDFLKFVLSRYESDGVEELGEDKIGDLIKLSNLGSIQDAKNAFGGLAQLKEAYYQLQENIYKVS
jgi:type I restriction enzyme, R subunit